MVNPMIRAEIDYSHIPEIPLALPLSLSGISPSSNLYTPIFPPEGRWKPETGNSPTPCFFMPGGAGWTLEPEILSALHPPGQSWKPEAGNWKLPPTPEWPGADARRKLEAGNSSPVWLPTPEAGSWKFDSRSLERDQQDNIPQQSD